jgi:hypothetical protein
MARGRRRSAAAPPAAALLVMLTLLVALSEGHGIMVHPRSRNWMAYLDWNFPWAHGLSMGGASQWGPSGRRLPPVLAA